MLNDTVSIIVPIYNKEKYLENVWAASSVRPIGIWRSFWWMMGQQTTLLPSASATRKKICGSRYTISQTVVFPLREIWDWKKYRHADFFC